MERKILINETIRKINRLPDIEIKELNDFADFLLSEIEDRILQEGLQKITSSSKSFDFLKDEEDIYTVNDLKER